jgi:phosphatidylglycerophosphatase A
MQRSLSATGRLLITSLGLGLLRPAPGTWGSLPPVLVAAGLVLLRLGPHDGQAAWWIYHLVLLFIVKTFACACIRYGDAAETHFGKKDPGSVTADETAGMCLVLAHLPDARLDTPIRALIALAAAFVLFRLCDILKPWPAYQLQRVPGGWGILLDDLVAGIQALVALQLVWALLR